MYAREENVEAVLRWLRVLANDDAVSVSGKRSIAASDSRRWAAFGLSWLAGDLLPDDWLLKSRAAAVARAAFDDPDVSDPAFEDLWTLLVRTPLDSSQMEVLWGRQDQARRRFGPFCPTRVQREVRIKEGTYIERPFELQVDYETHPTTGNSS